MHAVRELLEGKPLKGALNNGSGDEMRERVLLELALRGNHEKP